MPPAARKTPQDRKPKAMKPGQFVGLDGETYTLPDPTESMNLSTGRDLRDIALGDDVQQVAVGFRILERTGVDPVTLDALYDLPAEQVGVIMVGWMQETDLPNA